MIAADPAGCLAHYPMPMSRFGLNPFGENKFRIVRASTRRHIVFGQWNQAGTPRAKYVLTYPHLGEGWILEEWQTAYAFTGMTAERWNSDPQCTLMGPYPYRGEYSLVGGITIDPENTNIERLIQLVHAGDKYSFAEKLTACKIASEKTEAEKAALCKDIIRDALPSFGTADIIGYGGRRSGKAKPEIKYSARDLRRMGINTLKPRNAEGVTTGGAQVIVPKHIRRKVA